MSSISGISSNYLQSILNGALQNTSSTTNQTADSLTSLDASLTTPPADKSRLSPFAQMMSVLQQLQQSDPTKYQQVTQQIATNLKTAAQTAQSNGNTAAAQQLNQLSTDFSNASQNGQLPNVQDVAQAAGGHHHHHHSHAGSDSDNSSNSTNPLLAAFQNSATQNNSQNPMAIIMETLSNAGISTSNT